MLSGARNRCLKRPAHQCGKCRRGNHLRDSMGLGGVEPKASEAAKRPQLHLRPHAYQLTRIDTESREKTAISLTDRVIRPDPFCADSGILGLFGHRVWTPWPSAIEKGGRLRPHGAVRLDTFGCRDGGMAQWCRHCAGNIVRRRPRAPASDTEGPYCPEERPRKAAFRSGPINRRAHTDPPGLSPVSVPPVDRHAMPVESADNSLPARSTPPAALLRRTRAGQPASHQRSCSP